MMTLVRDHMPVAADEIVDFSFSDQALNQSDVDQPFWLATSASDHADSLAR
jgi:hypothetical protein